MLVDGRSDYEHHVLRGAEHRRVGRRDEILAGDALKNRGGFRLVERQLSGGHCLDGGSVDVVEPHLETSLGEGEAEREPDTSASTDDGDIEREGHQLLRVTIPADRAVPGRRALRAAGAGRQGGRT